MFPYRPPEEDKKARRHALTSATVQAVLCAALAVWLFWGATHTQGWVRTLVVCAAVVWAVPLLAVSGMTLYIAYRNAIVPWVQERNGRRSHGRS